jgi:hypothetical protein
VAKRAAGSDRGRPSIDWEEAFRTYASLPDRERSYGAVADAFGVSVRTVETHGRKSRWKERLARIKAEAADASDKQLADRRLEQLAEVNLLIDASLTTYAHQLRAGTVKVVPADLLRLYKLREDLWAQLAAESGARHAEALPELDPEDAERRKLELIAALEEAGAFERLRDALSPEEDDATQDAA